MPRLPAPHELGVLVAFVAALAACVTVTIVNGSAAAVELGFRELIVGLAIGLGAVTVPRRRPPGG